MSEIAWINIMALLGQVYRWYKKKKRSLSTLAENKKINLQEINQTKKFISISKKITEVPDLIG